MTSARSLSVILAADAVGYSRMSEKDEAAALAAVTWFRERAAEIVAAHEGHIFFRAGDGVMAELPTARAGVRAALELAETVRGRVAHSNKPALPVRIGLHLGEVSVESDGDRLGHDVNVAARLQQLAEPGEVLVSRALADIARGKADVRFERVGAERLKNLSEPIEMFRVVAAAGKRSLPVPLVAAAVAVVALAIGGLLVLWVFEAEPTMVAASETAPAATVSTAAPSIAVLPFVNMSSDPEQEYFSDGLSEELLNQLAQLDGLRVIARTSSFAFKGENADVRTIAQTLGVAHVLEGSVRKSGDQLRITAQLIDASDGSHLWSSTYDRQLDDVFAIQDEIARAVADELSLSLGLAATTAEYGGAASFEAYDHYLRGLAHASRFEEAELEQGSRSSGKRLRSSRSMGSRGRGLPTPRSSWPSCRLRAPPSCSQSRTMRSRGPSPPPRTAGRCMRNTPTCSGSGTTGLARRAPGPKPGGWRRPPPRGSAPTTATIFLSRSVAHAKGVTRFWRRGQPILWLRSSRPTRSSLFSWPATSRRRPRSMRAARVSQVVPAPPPSFSWRCCCTSAIATRSSIS